MALIFCDGFDSLLIPNLSAKWTNILPSSGNMSYALITSRGRRGGGALTIYPYTWPNLTANYAGVQKTFPAKSTVITGFAFRVSALPTSAQIKTIAALWDSSTQQVELRLQPDGTIQATRNGTVLGTSTWALPINQYNYFEWKATIHPTAGAIEVRANGVTIISLTNVNTRNSTNSTVNMLHLGVLESWVASTALDYDDCYIVDTSGAVNNDFLGDVKITPLLPTAQGANNDFTAGSSGGGAHRYWRLLFLGTQTFAQPVDLFELQMRTSLGGANVCTGGTILTNNVNTARPAGNAFDGSLSTFYETASFVERDYGYLGYDFGAGNAKSIVEVAVYVGGTTTNDPVVVSIQYSDDGANWVSVKTVETGSGDWPLSAYKVFNGWGSAPSKIAIMTGHPHVDPWFYNQSNTAGAIDTYVTQDLALTGGNILAVQGAVYARKDDAGGRYLAPVMKNGATTAVGNSTPVLADLTACTHIWETDPSTGSAWTESSVNASEFGVKITA